MHKDCVLLAFATAMSIKRILKVSDDTYIVGNIHVTVYRDMDNTVRTVPPLDMNEIIDLKKFMQTHIV